jgi:hypothetical protein
MCTENEEEVGRAIRESGVPRSEIFVTTKLYAFPSLVIPGVADHRPLAVQTASTTMSLPRLMHHSRLSGSNILTCT